MLNTIGDLKDEFLVRMQGNTSVAFYSDTIISDWINQAHRFAAAYKKWPFTEGRASTTMTTTGNSDNEGYSYPEGWKPDSIRILQIGGYLHKKLNYEDYLIFREDRASSDLRVYTDHAFRYYINPSTDASGTITVWGQFTPAALDTTDTTATTLFSNREEQGNEAIVQLMLSYGKTREKKPQESQSHFQTAIAILEGIWKRVADEQFAYQTKDRSMFKRFDVLHGAISDELLERDQFF